MKRSKDYEKMQNDGLKRLKTVKSCVKIMKKVEKIGWFFPYCVTRIEYCDKEIFSHRWTQIDTDSFDNLRMARSFFDADCAEDAEGGEN
jgi:hypothetical protein